MKKRFFRFITYVVVFLCLYNNAVPYADSLQPNSAFVNDPANNVDARDKVIGIVLRNKIVVSKNRVSSDVITVWDGKADLAELLKDADIVILGAPNSVIDELLRRDLSGLKGLKVVYLGNIRRGTGKEGQDMESVLSAILRINPNIRLVQMPSLGVFEIIPVDNPDGRTVKLGVELLVEYFNGVVGRKSSVMKGVVKGEAVGIIRIIPDVVEGYRELFGLRENEIAVVPRYPTEDPTFARPMGIVTCDEFGRLSHAEVRARFWGLPHAVVGDLDSLAGFNGKWVYMKVEGDNVEFRLAAEDEIANWESYKPKIAKPRLAEVDLTTPKNILPWYETQKPSEVSYKFANLNLVRKALSAYGDTHPWYGMVIPFATYKRVLSANNGAEERIREIVGSIDNNDIDDIRQKLSQVQQIIEGLDIPEEIWGNADNEKPDIDEAWNIDYSIRNETFFKDGLFIRTGTNAEDLPDYPGLGAGLYGTYSNIMRRDAKAYVKKAWASVWNLGAYLERQKLGIDHFGVYPVVQITKPVDASYAFVIHTADPNGSDTNLMVIEIVQGLGEGLVGDKCPGEPYRYLYDKKQDRIVDYKPAAKRDRVVLNPEGGTKIMPVDYTEDILMRDGPDSVLVSNLARSAVRIEKAFNRPQDIEGAFRWDERDKRYIGDIFQSRSQVGYDRYPTPWEEFYRENIDWAMDVSREALQYADNVWTRDAHGFIYEKFFERLTQRISEIQSTRLIQDELSRWLRLFYSLGPEGRVVIRLMISNCSGYHHFFIEAIRRLEPDLIAKILDLIVVDTFGLSKDEFEKFHKNNGQVISYLLVERIKEEDVLRQILDQVELMTLIGIINETWNWYKKPLDIIRLFSERIAKLSNEDMIFVIRRLSQRVITWLGMEKEYIEVSVKEFLGALVNKAKNCKDIDEELIVAVDTDIGNLGEYAQELMTELRRLKIDNVRILVASGAELKRQLQGYIGKKGLVISAVLKNSNCILFEDMRDKIRITAVEDEGLGYIPIIPIIELAIKRAMGGSRDELAGEYSWLPDVKGIIEQEGILIIHLLPKPIPLQADEIRERYREEAVILSSA